jgi:hypothetical protein
MAKYSITVSEVHQLAKRLENRASSIVTKDQEKTRSDLLIAAALMRQLTRPLVPTSWTFEVDNGK